MRPTASRACGLLLCILAIACGTHSSPTMPSGSSNPRTAVPSIDPVAPDPIITSALFERLFPTRNPFYTYAAFRDAMASQPAFAATGEDTVRRQEAAAFLANVGHETVDLVYIEEIAKADYCDPLNAQYPCAGGKQYFGRGPLQLSWNYNYGAAGAALALPLLTNPERVSQDDAIAWRTSLWYWMTQKGPGMLTPHDAMTRGAGFGEVIRSLNGTLECRGGNPGGVQDRMNRYLTVAGLLGVTPGMNLGC